MLPWIRRRHRMAELGEGFQWGRPLSVAPGCRIGRYVYLGAGFESAGTVSVGDLSMISSGCKIVGADHLYDVVGTPTRLAFASGHRTTTIGADVWIGMRATVLEGVTIGDGAVVGSGAIVTQDIPPFSIAVGVPARVLRQRFSDDELERHQAALHETVSIL
jgi:acetyltransferase-like isoleucine patch superfamily enzyme